MEDEITIQELAKEYTLEDIEIIEAERCIIMISNGIDDLKDGPYKRGIVDSIEMIRKHIETDLKDHLGLTQELEKDKKRRGKLRDMCLPNVDFLRAYLMYSYSFVTGKTTYRPEIKKG